MCVLHILYIYSPENIRSIERHITFFFNSTFPSFKSYMFHGRLSSMWLLVLGSVFSLHVICTLLPCTYVGCHTDHTFAARGPKQVLQLNGCFYRLSAVVLQPQPWMLSLFLVMPHRRSLCQPVSGLSPNVDLDDPMGSAPVTAYFQFVQQNTQQVYNGNEDAITAEAEQRHKEVSAQWMDTVKAKFHQAILEVEGRHHEEVSSVKQQAQSSYDKLQAELSAARARIFKLENDKALEAEAKKAEMDSLRTQLMHECQQTANAITVSAEQGVVKLRAELDEHELKLQRGLREAENENYSLQQIIDDLRADNKDTVEPEYIPTSMNASPMMTPRQGEQEKKGTFETIAAEASARLSGLFGPKVPVATVTGDAPAGATAPLKPVLPVLGGTGLDSGKTPTHLFHSPAPSIREPHKPA